MAMASARNKTPKRQLDDIILHFDYDCFYASVVEHETPSLKFRPLGIQQKQIIVTCNYEARRRGLHKLQLISEAKKACPDLVIVLGEDLTRFRNASKELYAFLRSFSWNARCERLGFDEVFLDVSDIIDYNVHLLNANDPGNSFFCLSKDDPTVGFPFNATTWAGYAYPEAANETLGASSLDPLHLRLLLASHLAQHLRDRLDSEKGYTATVGVSTNKLLSKLVGNLHKPDGQTVLLPPYTSGDLDQDQDNVTSFMDSHEVGKIPGIGFKTAQKLRAHVLQRPATFDNGLVYGGTKEQVQVSDVRNAPGMGPETLERMLAGPGTPRGIGARVWALLNGCDDTPVSQAREIPRQISIEDSYIRLNTLDAVTKELRMLLSSLLKRMHTDLLEDEEEDGGTSKSRRWLAHAKTLRLSTRPRPPSNPDGRVNRSFARISKSAPMPTLVFSLKEGIDTVVEKLLMESALPLFRKLHPEKSGWDLSLVNVAATNIVEVASERGGVGRDISKMFKFQDEALKPWRVEKNSEKEAENAVREDIDSGVGEYAKRYIEEDVIAIEMDRRVKETPNQIPRPPLPDRRVGSEDDPTPSQEHESAPVDHWESEDEEMLDADAYLCHDCGAMMPAFAQGAHQRWHAQN